AELVARTSEEGIRSLTFIGVRGVVGQGRPKGDRDLLVDRSPCSRMESIRDQLTTTRPLHNFGKTRLGAEANLVHVATLNSGVDLELADASCTRDLVGQSDGVIRDPTVVERRVD